MYTTETTFRTHNALISISDILFLKEELPQRRVYDVTAKFAQDMIDTLRAWCLKDGVNGEEARRCWKHIERYEEILDRHTTYEDDPCGNNDPYGYSDIRYSYK